MATITGTNGNNTLTGTSRADTISALGGNDRVYANGGNDVVAAGLGNDGIYGQGGDDTLYGEDGVDALFGAAGNDQLFGGFGDDWLDAGDGNDRLFGNEGSDRLRAGNGNDVLDGGAGSDSVIGGSGDDVFFHAVSGLVTQSNDTWIGEAGTDKLIVNAGTATVSGSGGVLPGIVHIGLSSSDYTGSMSISDPDFTAFVPQGYFAGINVFDIEDTSTLHFRGGLLNTYAFGGNNADEFYSGSASEVFVGGASADSFHFDAEFEGSDYIVGFVPGEDVIVSKQLWDSNDGQIGTRTITEVNGHSIVQNYDLAGTLTGQIDVDAVGIQNSFVDGWSWGL